MPKITKQRQHSQAFHPYRTNKAEDDDVPTKTNINLPGAEKKASDAKDGSAADKPLSRGQKKRLERKEHIMQKIGLKQPQMKNGPAASTQAKQTQPSKKKNNSGNNSNGSGKKSEAEQAQALLLSTLDEMDDDEDSNEEEGDDNDDERVFLAAQAQLMSSSNKLKKEVAVREANRIKLVQQHPLFQENPIDAIQQHLQKITGKSLAEVTAIPSKK